LKIFYFCLCFHKEGDDFMYLKLSPDDQVKVSELAKMRQRNNGFCWMLCDYLNNNPSLITKEMIEKVVGDTALPEEIAYEALLASFCKLTRSGNEEDNQLADDYFRRVVKRLDPETYLRNPYYQNIKIPEVQFGNWTLTYQKYQPYEAFIYKDMVEESIFREFPLIGFFDQDFRFPTVMEDAHEWMSIKPSELETSQPALDEVEGRVVTFGLGLGYFAYMASLKENVKSVTIVEHDARVIELFRRYILPQFHQREKIEIVLDDAFLFMEKQMPGRNFDYAFVDLWHDVSDGLELYLRTKKLEHLSPATKFLYWVEDSLLLGLRWQVFDWVTRKATSYDEVVRMLSKPFLQQLAGTISLV